MPPVKTIKGLIGLFKSAPSGVRRHFKHLPGLLTAFPLDVSLSYLFARIEAVHIMTLYCGLTKLHKTQSDVTWEVLQRQHITRSSFTEYYETVLGEILDQNVLDPIQRAEKTRDLVIHGKRVSAARKREAVADIIEYATLFDGHTNLLGKFRPFGGDLRGYKGRGKSLSKTSTRWVLKGMGFHVT